MLLLDVYHELACPREVMEKVSDSLKPNGRVVFGEYRKEDPEVSIEEVHKMSVQQLEKQMAAVELIRKRTIKALPLQHSRDLRKESSQIHDLYGPAGTTWCCSSYFSEALFSSGLKTSTSILMRSFCRFGGKRLVLVSSAMPWRLAQNSSAKTGAFTPCSEKRPKI